MTDIVLPKNNEEEFIEVASKLGIKRLYFLYDSDEFKAKKEILNGKNIPVETGIIANQKNFNQTYNQSRILIAKGTDNSRFLIETKKVRVIYGFEEGKRMDYMGQKSSGLNHVTCELAAKNNVIIGLSYSSLFDKNEQLRAILMGRIMQNIKLCQKYKTKTLIASFSSNPYDLRSSHDLGSLFSMLGMDRKRINVSLNSTL